MKNQGKKGLYYKGFSLQKYDGWGYLPFKYDQRVMNKGKYHHGHNAKDHNQNNGL